LGTGALSAERYSLILGANLYRESSPPGLPRRIAVITDSLDLVESLQGARVEDAVDAHLRERLLELARSAEVFVFHENKKVGGNGRVDSAAKAVLVDPLVGWGELGVVSLNVVKATVKASLLASRKGRVCALAGTSPTLAHLGVVSGWGDNPVLGRDSMLSRREEIAFNRLRLDCPQRDGHWGVEATCVLCGKPESAFHYLYECSVARAVGVDLNHFCGSDKSFK
jgi:hypothetical protein